MKKPVDLVNRDLEWRHLVSIHEDPKSQLVLVSERRRGLYYQAIRGMEGELFVGECKWGEVSDDDLEILRRRGRILADELGGVSAIHYGLFSGSGKRDRRVAAAAKAGEAHFFSPEDLFA